MKWFFGGLAFLSFFLFQGVGAQSNETRLDSNSFLSLQTPDGGIVDQIYQKCQDQLTNPENTQNFQTCVQEYLDSKEDSIEKFKKEVRRGQESVPVNTQRSLLQKFLSEYLDKRFEEKVRKGADGKKRLVDHSTYFELYEVQLSKIVFTTINSYCMYADSSEFDSENDYFPLVQQAERANAFETNKHLLKGSVRGRRFFKLCAATISNACENGETNSKREACSVLGHLRKLNRAATRNKQIMESFQCRNGNESEKCQVGFEGHGVEFYQPGQQGHGRFDEITGITAGEFHKKCLRKN